jgi:hypothetical protein
MMLCAGTPGLKGDAGGVPTTHGSFAAFQDACMRMWTVGAHIAIPESRSPGQQVGDLL